MAAFSTLALIGLAAAGGAFAAKKLGGKKQPAQTATAPGPTSSSASTVPQTPPVPDANVAASTAVKSAGDAAQRQRRKARGGFSKMPIGGIGNSLAAPAEPKTLIGY